MLRLALFTFCVNCARPAAIAPPKTIDVRVVEMPDKQSCWLSDIPAPPPMKELNYEDDDIVRRVFVHFIDHNAVIQWTMDMVNWAEEMERCIYSLTGQEP